MKAKMVRPIQLPSFKINDDKYMWEQVNDHHLSYIQESVYYNGWNYAVYVVDDQEFLSRVRIVGIGRKGGVRSERHKKSLEITASELDVNASLIEDNNAWWGGDPSL